MTKVEELAAQLAQLQESHRRDARSRHATLLGHSIRDAREAVGLPRPRS
jgi:hypothetical protein